jgi:putative hydrolase of the HAD superfamily
MADLKHITDWVFDLDNTLYPSRHNLFDQIDKKMTNFIAQALDLDAIEARRLQKLYLRDYGTTLAGLMKRHAMSPDAFLDFVHDIDVSVLSPAPELSAQIEQLPGRKYIFTNGTKDHADRVMERLGVEHHFEGIFDIIEAKYRPKPHADIYPMMLEQFNLEPKTTAFFEDMSRNLKPAHALGMTTILIRDTSNLSDEYKALGFDETGDYVHHETHDLSHFLDKVLSFIPSKVDATS